MLLKHTIGSTALSEIYNVRESFDGDRYPTTKISKTITDINADGVTLRVFLNRFRINNVNCMSVKFVDPHVSKEEGSNVTNHHKRNPIRIFTTIAHLIKQHDFNVLLCVADNVDINVEDRKHNLYNVMFRRFERLGEIHTVQSITLPHYEKQIITGQRKISLNNQQLQHLVVEFANRALSST